MPPRAEAPARLSGQLSCLLAGLAALGWLATNIILPLFPIWRPTWVPRSGT